MHFLKKTLFFFFLFIIGNSEIYAATGDVDITVSPIRYEMEADRGQSASGTIKVINNSEHDIFLRIEKEDCDAKDSAGTPTCFPTEKNENPSKVLAPYITISTGSLNIESKTETDIGFILSVPEDATPGGKYGAIFFKGLDQLRVKFS